MYLKNFSLYFFKICDSEGQDSAYLDMYVDSSLPSLKVIYLPEAKPGYVSGN